MKIAIVGLGMVGTSLAVLLARAGHQIVGALDTDREARVRFTELTGCPASPALADIRPPLDLILIAVPDRAVRSASDSLAGLELSWKGLLVGHTSGALGRDALKSLDAKGCLTFSMHPIQTFSTIDSAVSALPASYFAVEGNPESLAAVDSIVSSIGATPVHIDPALKPLYHAALTAASNFLVTLLDAASTLLEAAGIEREKGMRIMLPLITATLSNFKEMGGRALTGPIERGDTETVEKQLAAVARADPRLLGVYTALARATFDLAVRKGSISETARERFLAVLQSVDTPTPRE